MSPLLPEPAEALLGRYQLSRAGWPDTSLPGADTLQDRFRGALVWGAIGDALGRPTEARSWQRIRDRWGPDGVTDLHPWHGWTSGPIGTWTDDTQLTIELARTIVESDGYVDPEQFSERLRAWLPVGRGKGRATTEAILWLEDGLPWWEAGPRVNSAGNGAAMRAAPVGLAWSLAPDIASLVREACISALPTHGHPVGVAGAVAIAAGVAWCVRSTEPSVDPGAFLAFVAESISGIESEPTPLRSDPNEAVTLRERILGVGELLDVEPKEVFLERLWSGAFALESVPAALYCFLRSPEQPRDVILTAANAGHDTDTIASMAGNLVGAHHGADRLRDDHPGWWDELEDRDGLLGLADGLLDVARDHADADRGRASAGS